MTPTTIQQKSLAINDKHRCGPPKKNFLHPQAAQSQTREDIYENECFDKACGGYTAVILNNAKNGEFKYQIYSTRTQNKLYTNDVKRFIEGVIKICDPIGKSGIEMIRR